MSRGRRAHRRDPVSVLPGCSDRRTSERSHELLSVLPTRLRPRRSRPPRGWATVSDYEASISPSSLATRRRSSGWIVSMSMMSPSVLVAVAHQAVSPHPALASRFPERRRSWPRRMPPGRRQADIQPLASDSRRPRAGPCSRRCGTDAARARRRGAQRRASPLLTCGSLERTTGFEPATPTLARWCSTN